MGAAVHIQLGSPGAGNGTHGWMLANDAMRGHVSGRHTCGEGYHDQFKLPATAGVCDQCAGTDIKRRADDTAETVHERLNADHARTARLIAQSIRITTRGEQIALGQ